MDLQELRTAARLIDRLAKRALFAEKQMVALEGQCAEWRRIADELKAERNAERAAHAELHMKHKELEREKLAKMVEHRAEFGERMRLKAELAVVKDERDQLRVERDALRAQLDTERERHKQTASILAQSAPKTVDVPRAHPVKVGEYVKNDNGDVCQVHEVYAEYLLNTGWIWAFEHCTPCDPPTASHDTPAGKQAAESAVKREPEPGDTVRLVRIPTPGLDFDGFIDFPWNTDWGVVGDVATVVATLAPPNLPVVAVRVSSGIVVWWPLSCVEIVEDAK